MKIVPKTRAAASGRGPVLRISPMQLVMLLLIEVEPAIGIAVCSAGAILQGLGGDVWEMVKENFA